MNKPSKRILNGISQGVIDYLFLNFDLIDPTLINAENPCSQLADLKLIKHDINNNEMIFIVLHDCLMFTCTKCFFK